MSDTWTFVCPTGELLPGEMKVAFDEVTGVAIAVFNLDGDLYALEDRCSHEEFELSSGAFDAADGSVERMELATGSGNRDLDRTAGGSATPVRMRFGPQAVGHHHAITPGMVERRPRILVRLPSRDVPRADHACAEAPSELSGPTQEWLARSLRLAAFPCAGTPD